MNQIFLILLVIWVVSLFVKEECKSESVYNRHYDD